LDSEVRTIQLTYFNTQITKTLFGNPEIKLNKRVDMVVVWLVARCPYQVDPDALEFDCSDGHFDDLRSER
jgi:hypothetical protein